MIAVITHCTKIKLSGPAPAKYLYRGPMASRVVKVVERARARGLGVDLYFLSAKYGLVGEYDVLEPYDLVAPDADESIAMRASEEVSKLLKKYNLIILNLTKNYLKLLNYIFNELCNNSKVLFIISHKLPCANTVSSRPLARHVELNRVLEELAK